jgi:acetyl-CoA C-acetyltransferase
MTAFLTAACRSPVVPRDGAFAGLEFHALAAPVVQAVLAEAGIAAEEVDEIIVSNALGGGGNPARSVALAAGLPERVAGLSLDRQCAGGLDAILLARLMVEAGEARVVVAGGVESYSRRPIRLRTFADGRAPEEYAQAAFTPWPDRDPDMTEAAAALALQQGIGREEMDRWAVESHAKARAATPSTGEIVPISGIDADSFTRVLSDRLCARATPLCGDVTAANTAVAADGAAFCLVTNHPGERAAIRLVGGTTLGGQPDLPGIAPVEAARLALQRADWKADALEAVEIMEAYAVQAIACQRGIGLDPQRVNLGGGALARGHPIGASGAINAVRLFHELRKSGGRGLAAIAAAGGIGSALLLSA